jgi:signal transduction histidine kinase
MARADRPRDPQTPLRSRAEAQVRRQRDRAQAPEAVDLRRVVHELEVHQVELQMQNEELLAAQAAVTVARDRYASLFDLAPVAYLVLDHTGTILQANNTACALLDRPRHRLLRRALSGFVAPNDRAGLARHLEEAAAAAGRSRPLRAKLEGAPVRIVRLETVREAAGPAGGHEYRTTMIDLTDQALAEERLRAERMALERSQAALRELTRRLMVAEEAERRRIAADLHDDIGQRLHAVQIELAVLRRRPSGKAGMSGQVDAVCHHLEEIVGDLEGLARNLHPKIVDDLGLRVALKAHVENLRRQTHIVVQYRDRAVPEVIPADVASCLYRVAQEALRNVHRHAGAGAAMVTLARVRRGLGLCVADSGRGFDPEQARLSGRGLGLVTMQERVGGFGGHLRVRANPGDGTHVHAWVPLS